MYAVDERGSKDQRILYDFLVELYPQYEVIYEFPLFDLNQRIDLFIPYLGIAVEYNGRQHYEFIEHFHKDLSGFESSKLQDSKKSNYLVEKGIKLLCVDYNNMVNSKEELKERLDALPYPLNEYEILESTNVNKKSYLNKQKLYRQEQAKKYKKQRLG